MSKANNNIFTGFQWALIEFLQTISSEFIFGKIVPHWKEKISEKRFGYNILIGFLNVYEMLDHATHWEAEVKKRIESIFSRYFPGSENRIIPDIQGRILTGRFESTTTSQREYRDLLNDLLEEEGHLLFNSYFYTLEEVYGHERLFFGKIGYNPADDNAIETFTNNLAYFDKQKLPFRVYNANQFALTYANQLLPVSAGVTPHFLQKATLLAEKSNPKRLFNVKYFLESLSLLHKREDFIQGHNSALIYVFEKESHFDRHLDKYFGTLILTCIIPGILEKEDEEGLLKIIERGQHTRSNLNDNPYALQYPNKMGNITDQYHPSSFSLENFKVHHPPLKDYKSPLITKNAIADLNAIANENFNTILGVMPVNNQIYLQLAYQYFVEGYVKESKHHIINTEALYYITRMLFPTETTVDYNLVSGTNNEKENINSKLDFKELKRYNNLINDIFSIDPAKKSAIDKEILLSKSLFCQFLYCLFPEKEFNEDKILKHIHTEKISFADGKIGPYRLVLFVEDENNREFIKSVYDLRNAITSCLKESINLPDGENPIFLSLERYWIESHKTLDKRQANPTINDKTKTLFSLIKEIATKRGVRGMFILRERNYYIPNLANIDDKDFINCIQTYPSFWLFERLCSYLGDAPHLYDFEALGKESRSSLGRCMSFLYRYEQAENNKITVNCNPKSQEENLKLNRTLLFLGIHITELRFDLQEDNLQPVIQIDDGENYYDVRSFYKAYLKVRIKKLITLNSSIISSIFTPYTIKLLDWDEKDAKKINIKFLLSKDGKETFYEVPWEANRSCEIEMAILNIDKISSSLASQHDLHSQFIVHDELRFAGKGKLQIEGILSHSGKMFISWERSNRMNLKELSGLYKFNAYVSNLQKERNRIDEKRLFEFIEVYLHRIKRANQRIQNNFDLIDNEANKLYFILGFHKVKEAQRQLYAVSRIVKFSNFEFNFAEGIQFENILIFFYLKNVNPEAIYSYVFNNNIDSFKTHFYNKLIRLIKFSQINDEEPFDKKFFTMLSAFGNDFLVTFKKINDGNPDDVPLPKLVCQPNKVLFGIPTTHIKYFWAYFSCIIDEVMDNSFRNSHKLVFRFDKENKQMFIESFVKHKPNNKFIKKYNKKSFIKDIRPILDESDARINFGIYGLKIACEALGWELGIRYDEKRLSIIHNIVFINADLLL